MARRAARTSLLAVLALVGCASSRAPDGRLTARVEVLTPIDGVPVRSSNVWLPGPADEAARRTYTLSMLRADLAEALVAEGAEVCDGEVMPPEGVAPRPLELARQACADGVEVVVASELVAYGDVRRSWLWILAGQGLVAGIGHGVAAAAVTGSSKVGWYVGLGEFALETVTWVGGALVASHVVDPVIARIWAYDCRRSSELGHWTMEGTRPFKEWLHHENQPPRGDRLRTVAGRLFTRAAHKLGGHYTRTRPRAAAQVPSGGRDGNDR